MTLTQIVFGIGLILVLVLAGGLFAWRQIRSLRAAKEGVPSDEARYQRRQAILRLSCSILMLVLAILLTIALLFLEAPAQEMADQQQPFTPEQKRFLNFYRYYWIVFLLILLGMLVLAGIDFWTTRRYGILQYRRIQRDRRVLIEQEAAHLKNLPRPKGD